MRFVGDLEQLAPPLRKRMDAATALTAGNTRMTLVIAIAYGGRWDIAPAARRLAERCVAGELRADDIDEERLGAQLALAGLPDPDLLIRTGGEQRISNFLLWKLAYTELYFCDALWPDFDERRAATPRSSTSAGASAVSGSCPSRPGRADAARARHHGPAARARSSCW